MQKWKEKENVDLEAEENSGRMGDANLVCFEKKKLRTNTALP